MDSYENLMWGTKYGPVVIPGASFSSRLYLLVADKAHPVMRMPHGKPPLSEKEVLMIKSWIDQGAKPGDTSLP